MALVLRVKDGDVIYAGDAAVSVIRAKRSRVIVWVQEPNGEPERELELVDFETRELLPGVRASVGVKQIVFEAGPEVIILRSAIYHDRIVKGAGAGPGAGPGG